jgi:hypothetical protein
MPASLPLYTPIGCTLLQCGGSGSGLNGVPGSVSGFAIRIWIQEDKNEQQKWSAGCPIFKDEGFSCSMDVVWGGLVIRKLQVLIKETIQNCQLYFFPNFWSWKLKTLDPDPDSLQMLDPDPQHCFANYLYKYVGTCTWYKVLNYVISHSQKDSLFDVTCYDTIF